MKHIFSILLGAPLLGACTHLLESDTVGPEVFGTWSGQGRFLDRDLAAEYGSFPVDLEIHPDRSVSGHVGAATLGQAEVKRRPEDFLIDGTLSGQIFERSPLPGEAQNCVVLLLAPPGDSATEADLHLKSRRSFDPRMRVCDVKLVRVP